MKITIEPTEHVDDFVTVSVASASDDGDIHAVAELLRVALVAWGFDEKSVRSVLDCE